MGDVENLTEKQITELNKLYCNYHRLTKCHKWKYKRQRRLKITLQTASLGLAAIGAATAIANPLTTVITGAGFILGGILSKSNLHSRITQSKFAYTTYEGILHQIKTILRSGNFDIDTEIICVSDLRVIDCIVTDCRPSVVKLFEKYDSKYSANFEQKDSNDELAIELAIDCCKSTQICLKNTIANLSKFQTKYSKNKLVQ